MVTDADGARLLDGLDLGVARRTGRPHRRLAAYADRAGRPRGRRRRALVAGSDARPRGPVPAAVHLGDHRHAQGGAVHPGTAGRPSPCRGRGLRLRPRRRGLLHHAAVPRQRPDGAVGAVAGGRGHRGAGPAVQRRRGLWPTCAGTGPPPSPTWARPWPTCWPPRPRPDDATTTLRRGFGTEASVADHAAFERRFGCVLTEGYGSSEGGVAISRTPDTPSGLARPAVGRRGHRRPGDADGVSAGRSSTPAGRLVNGDAAIGEIVNRAGHRRGSRGTTPTRRPPPARTRNGWYWTGDLAYRDADGFFYFAGRRRRLDAGGLGEPDRRAHRAGPRPLTRTWPPWPSTRCPTRARATRSWPPSRCCPDAAFDPGRIRRLPRRPARPRHQVGPGVRPGHRRPAPDGQRQGDQGAAAGARAGGRRTSPVYRRRGTTVGYVPMDGRRSARSCGPSSVRHGRAGLVGG